MGHSNCAVVRCILKPLADALVGVEHPEEPALTFPSLTAARSPSDRIDDDDDDGASNATVLQRRVWSQSRDEARKRQATHLSLAGKVSACWIFELVMPHRDTARATGEERKTVTALTWGVLKSQIFTGKCISDERTAAAGSRMHTGAHCKIDPFDMRCTDPRLGSRLEDFP